MRVMADCGVELKSYQPDYQELIESDSLIADPPRRISSMLDVVEAANRIVDLYQALRSRPPI